MLDFALAAVVVALHALVACRAARFDCPLWSRGPRPSAAPALPAQPRTGQAPRP